MFEEVNKEFLIQKINEKESFALMIKTNWCGECIMTKPIYERVSNMDLFSTQKFYLIDADDFNMWVDDEDEFFSISEVPTIIKFINGIEKKRITNFVSEKNLLEFLE